MDGVQLIEIGWEVCQQLGGIYTVLRSKAPSFSSRLGRDYCLIGPYNPDTAPLEFEEMNHKDVFQDACNRANEMGLKVYSGTWLIPGRPRVLLLDLKSVAPKLVDIKYFFWEKQHIQLPPADELTDQVLLFGHMVEALIEILAGLATRPLIAQFHEWMAGTAIPELRRKKVDAGIVFTTHATLLGRYLAQADPRYLDRLPFLDPVSEAGRFGIGARFALESACAHGAHVFTTLSDVTALECQHLLKRKPDVLTPNGIFIERPVALHEFQNLHVQFKDKINQFITGHFFPSYTFDLDRTLYFFTAGRYEYRNKGFDLLLDSLARLNHRMKGEETDKTVVAFVITRRPYHTINPGVLANFALMEELRRTCNEIQEQVGGRLFQTAAAGGKADLNTLVDDYWWLRLRRTMHAWKSKGLPPIVTHNLVDDAGDDVLRQLRYLGLFNAKEDPVKVIYHPDFITETNPLFGMDYEQFTRGCHLGIFPSTYEPWGYTPLECVVRGIPAITSDLAGFGSYVAKHTPDHQKNGLTVIERRHRDFDMSSRDLTDRLFDFVKLERRERIVLRNRVEALSDQFDWNTLCEHYLEAYDMALKRVS
jgi:glycogen(starch) synthase